jgi:mRNA interferase RelE/StbE
VKTRFRSSFATDLTAISGASVLHRIKRVIQQVEQASTLRQIPNVKRLDAKGKYYRIRVGPYRVGLVFEDGAVTFVRCLNRKDIYRYFP